MTRLHPVLEALFREQTRLRLTDRELAARTGVSVPTLTMWRSRGVQGNFALVSAAIEAMGGALIAKFHSGRCAQKPVRKPSFFEVMCRIEQPFRARDLEAALRAHRIVKTDNSIRSHLSHLIRNGRVVKLARGLYCVPNERNSFL